MVSMIGLSEAVVDGDQLQVINLDRGEVFLTNVLPDGSFDVVGFPGLEFERYRLTAFNTSTRRYDEAVVTGDPNTEGVTEIPVEEHGCMRVEPTHLDLGETAPGDPLYGELVVTNDCGQPMVVLDVTVDNPSFTTVTMLMDAPLAPQAQGVIGIVFISPGGPPEGGMLHVMVESLEPANLPLFATLHAVAVP